MRSMEIMAKLGLSALQEGGADQTVCTVSRTVTRELTAEWESLAYIERFLMIQSAIWR